MLGRLIGIFCLLLGAVALYVAPVSTVACSKKSDGVSCHVEQAILGLIPRSSADIDRIERIEISHNEPSVEPGKRGPDHAQPNATYQLAFITPEGRIAPHGLDDSDTATLHEIVRQFDELKSGEGEAFKQRSYNTFPIVAGLIFFIFGVLATISGS
jgi:hypothetical protein